MASFRRPSGHLSAMVLALAEHPATWWYGYELCQRLDLTAGTLYQTLMRLADRGLLETSWEPEAPPDRPPRHRYRLSGPGRELAWKLAAGPPPAPASPLPAVGGIGRRPRLEGT